MESLVRSSALQGFDDLVAHCGGDPGDLRQLHGLELPATGGVDAMISLDAVACLLDDAARICRQPDFGLRLGTSQDPEALGSLAVVLNCAETLGQALMQVSEYLFLHSPNYGLVIEPCAPESRVQTLRFDVRVDPVVPYRHLIDGCLASLLSMARSLGGAAVRPIAVAVPHTPVASRTVYEEIFGAPVAFEQAKASVMFDTELLATPLAPIKPELRRRALAHLQSLDVTPHASVQDQVRLLIVGTLGISPATKAEVAHLLGLHPRSLQRRLEHEGLTFEQIRDEVRRTATARFLTDTTLPLSQAAHVLGFSEHSAMSRKVKQWFDMTPSQLRTAGLQVPL